MKRPTRRASLSLLALLALGAAGSGPAYLVEDVNTSAGDRRGSINEIAAAGGRLFLSVFNDGGTRLWVSDGTEAGTRALESRSTGPRSFKPFRGGIVFVASDPSHGLEVWRSDGTAAGTTLVKDVRPGPEGSSPFLWTVLEDILYFLANDGVHGWELWRSDGTPGGTTLVVDLVPGPAESGIGELAVIGSRLFFLARHADPGRPFGLWVSDGTGSGTRFVQSFATERQTVGRNTYDIGPGSLTGLHDVAYFFASDGVAGRELWRSDGTALGTALVRDIRHGPVGGCLVSREISRFDDKLYFSADDGMTGRELWRSDGTAESTALVADIAEGAVGSNPENFAPTPRILFFRATHPASGAELWRTDTLNRTSMVRDIRPGLDGSYPHPWSLLGDVIYFFAEGDLWVSDGSFSGTRVLKRGSASSPVALEERAYFSAADTASIGLWRTDGTEAGTALVKSIESRAGSSEPQLLADFSGELLFVATETPGVRRLWRSDGSAEGTVRVSDRVGFHSFAPPQPGFFRGALFVAGWDQAHGAELWRSDGTDAGTWLVSDISPGPGNVVVDSRPNDFTLVRDRLFFEAYDAAHGGELWKTDGTAAGTTLVKDVRPGPDGSIPSELTEFRGTLFFIALNGSTGGELWKSDGTEDGTVQVKDLRAGSERGEIWSLTPFGDRLFFAATHYNAPTSGLWSSDGTPEGTTMIRAFREIAYISESPFVSAGGRLFFAADDGIHGVELWTTDGTEAGTVLVEDIFPGAGDGAVVSYPRGLTGLRSVKSLVFFAGTDGIHGVELWRSDGSSQGTFMVRDANAGSFSSDPAELADVGGLLGFSANDGLNGVEAWVSNGTEAGTRMLQDIAPGPASSNPRSFLRSGGRVYFAANDGITGEELWAVPLSAIQAAAGRAIHAPRLLPFRP
ncbi:MAG: hypothetical protein M3542_12910 [Acidobacteriota bacterium]|nr:hypothetical protein [Acidobacteriota bacterium]MDQ5870580.1 hypothetical protein [Acidobacteriota bacterium]